MQMPSHAILCTYQAAYATNLLHCNIASRGRGHVDKNARHVMNVSDAAFLDPLPAVDTLRNFRYTGLHCYNSDTGVLQFN
eukprot:scaffold176553_cov22-Tisochrysis_lutea.AAC.1